MAVFGEEIKRIRRDLGLTQAAFGEAIGYSRTQVSNWERGEYREPPPRGEIEEWENKLDLSPGNIDCLLVAAGYQPRYGTSGEREAVGVLHAGEIHTPRLIFEGTEPPVFLSSMVSLDRYLNLPGIRFPKKADFEQGFVYLPETYQSRVETMLHDHGHCLLEGRSGSGKTVLALAIGRKLRSNDQYDVFYVDMEKTKEGDIRQIHQRMVGARQPTLYILDDCQNSPTETDFLCLLREDVPPRHAQALYITRSGERRIATRASDLPTYRDMLAGTMVEVHAEDIVSGMIESYARAIAQQKPSVRFASVTEDDPTYIATRLSHDLVVTRARLEAWGSYGGALSDVGNREMYEALRSNYLTDVDVALPALCALEQFGIPAHGQFLRCGLPGEEVDRLRERELLTSEVLPMRGELFRLNMHPEMARLIFEASIYTKYGRVEGRRWETETVIGLKSYLLTQPSNYGQVYSKLHWLKRSTLLRGLLLDIELQSAARCQFEIDSLLDMALYLRNLAGIDKVLAGSLLSQVIETTTPEKIAARLLEHGYYEISVTLRCLAEIDPHLTDHVLACIDWGVLARQSRTEESLVGVVKLVQVLRRKWPLLAQRLLRDVPADVLVDKMASISTLSPLLNYYWAADCKDNVHALVHALDMQALAARSSGSSVTSLFWLLRSISRVSKPQGSALVNAITLPALAVRCSGSPLSDANSILKALSKLDFETPELRLFVENLDMQALAARSSGSSVTSLFWLLRSISRVSKPQGSALVNAITLPALAVRCSGSPLSDAGSILRALSMLDFEAPELQLFVENLDMQALAKRASCSSAQVLHWFLRYLSETSEEFAAKFLAAVTPENLADRLTHANLASFSNILQRLDRLRYPADRLEQVIQLLDQSRLLRETETMSVAQFYWLLRILEKVSPVMYERVVCGVSSAKLAAMFRAQDASASDLAKLLRILRAEMRRCFIREFSDSDIEAVFTRSPLGQVGMVVQYYHRFVDGGYADFEAHGLPSKLSTESLDQVAKFIWRIRCAQPEWLGADLAMHALDLLMDIDLHQRVEASDLTSVSSLLYTAVQVTEGDELSQRAYLGPLRQAVQATNWTGKLVAASVGERSVFLWGVFENVDKVLARQLAQVADACPSVSEFGAVAADDLCAYLWHLVQILAPNPPMTCAERTVQERLVVECQSDFARGAQMLGVLATIEPGAGEHVRAFLPVEANRQAALAARFRELLDGSHAYLLALTLRGLRNAGPMIVDDLIRSAVDVSRVIELLQDALRDAITDVAHALLEDILVWLTTLQSRTMLVQER